MNNAINDWSYDAREHERQQLLRDSRLTFAQKLQWLEDAHHLVLQMQSAPTSSTRGEDDSEDDKELTSQ